MHKKKTFIIIAVVLAIGVIACAALAWWKVHDQVASDSPAKCGSVFQCIEKLDPNSNLDEMNKIIGWDGELVTDTNTNKTYSWRLADDTTIEAAFITYEDDLDENGNPFTSTSLHIEYPIGSEKTSADFSRWKEIQELLTTEDGVTYDQFVEMVGGVDGLVTGKDQTSKRYQWYDANGNYLSANFENDTKKCTFVAGAVE